MDVRMWQMTRCNVFEPPWFIHTDLLNRDSSSFQPPNSNLCHRQERSGMAIGTQPPRAVCGRQHMRSLRSAYKPIAAWGCVALSTVALCERAYCVNARSRMHTYLICNEYRSLCAAGGLRVHVVSLPCWLVVIVGTERRDRA